MKAIVKKAATKKARPFPKLMISDGEPGEPMDRIVLFFEPGKGVTIVPGHGGVRVIAGRYDTDWVMHSFRDFEGTVTLSND